MSELKFCPDCGSKLTSNIKFCPGCGHLLINFEVKDNYQKNNKREKILNKTKGVNKGVYIGFVIIMLVGALLFFINVQPSKEEAVINNQPKITDNVTYPMSRTDHSYSVAFAKNGKIILPLDVVKEKKFVKFDYIGDNKTIPLLAYLTEDGKIVTSISLCEPCDSKDFHIQGNNLICNSCGTTWNLNNLNAISGSCGKYPPDPIPSKVVGNEIQIDEYNVTRWVRRV